VPRDIRDIERKIAYAARWLQNGECFARMPYKAPAVGRVTLSSFTSFPCRFACCWENLNPGLYA
jgi:hypothetical protein